MATSDSLSFSKLLRDFSDLRAFSLKFLAGMNADEAMQVPDGFKNSLHWQLGHLLYTQSEALFKWCGEPSPLARRFKEYFGLGTSPSDYDSLVPDWDELLVLAQKQLRSLPKQVADRLHRPLAKPVKLMNLSMATAGETLPFLIAHEGEHLAHIKRLRKALRP